MKRHVSSKGEGSAQHNDTIGNMSLQPVKLASKASGGGSQYD